MSRLRTQHKDPVGLGRRPGSLTPLVGRQPRVRIWFSRHPTRRRLHANEMQLSRESKLRRLVSFAALTMVALVIAGGG